MLTLPEKHDTLVAALAPVFDSVPPCVGEPSMGVGRCSSAHEEWLTSPVVLAAK